MKHSNSKRGNSHWLARYRNECITSLYVVYCICRCCCEACSCIIVIAPSTSKVVHNELVTVARLAGVATTCKARLRQHERTCPPSVFQVMLYCSRKSIGASEIQCTHITGEHCSTPLVRSINLVKHVREYRMSTFGSEGPLHILPTLQHFFAS